MPLDGANQMFEAIPSENTGEGCNVGDPCIPNPCSNDELCLSDDDGYTCEPAGACLSNPCQNGGTCYPTNSHFVCKCPGGYEGDTCAAPLTGSPNMTMIIIICVFVLLLVILMIIFVLLMRRYRYNANKEKKHQQDNSFDRRPSISLDAVDNPGFNGDTFDDATMIDSDSKMNVMINASTMNGTLHRQPDIIDPNDLADATQPDSSSGGEHEHEDVIRSQLEPDAEHYDIENASSIAPSDIDVAYHYRHYHDQERRKHRRSPNPLLMHLQQQHPSMRASPISHTSSRQNLNNLSHRNTPNHMTHNLSGSPNIVLAHSTPLDRHSPVVISMHNQYPMVNLGSKETLRSTTPLHASRSTTPNHRSTTPNHRSHTPTYRSNTPSYSVKSNRSNTPSQRSHRSNTPSHRSLASPVQSIHSANSVHSVQSELRSVGHHSDVSSVRSQRSRTKSPLQVGLTLAAQSALSAQNQQKRLSPSVSYNTKVPLGLTVEEVAKLNTARPELMVGSQASTIDNFSGSDRGLSPPPVTHTSQPSPHNLLEAPSSDDDTNDSFTCSEVDSDTDRFPRIDSDFDPGSIILSRLAEVENENEYSEDPCSAGGHSEPGSLSTLFMSDEENQKPSKHGRHGKPTLNGSLKWEDFLNWGPRYDSFAGVFKDIAELQDVMAPSPQTILAPSPQTTITLEQTEEEFV